MKKGRYVTCKICKKSIYRRPYRFLKTKEHFCSLKCYRKVINPFGEKARRWKGGKQKVKCIICKKILYRFPCRAKKPFCSHQCFNKYRSIYIRGKNHPTWKGIKIERGYVLIYCPNHPYAHQNYVKEHRLKMEKKIGRYLNPKEIIHHINGNTVDNHIKNLQVLTQGKHVNIHRKNKKY